MLIFVLIIEIFYESALRWENNSETIIFEFYDWVKKYRLQKLISINSKFSNIILIQYYSNKCYIINYFQCY